MTNKPVSAQDKFMLRLPDGMREAIAERAKENGRSMNSEIVQILQDTLYGGLSLPMDEEFSRVYISVIENDCHDEKGNFKYDEFDKNNEKIDWLIDRFMARIDNDSQKFRELLNLKKEMANKKAP
ncbi:Arc family DNA-binding protein [Photorhabdus kayaii]|uniref:Arc family DNA-binding protein n=1 Tax=Photorhabdus kayaii TaxID=230088 RepID=UPI002A47C174|nr:Arc family DNA-binding protein [Photorhabdus kayaii]